MKKNGNFHPSPEVTLWAAAIKDLGCTFNLKVQVRSTVKDIIKKEMNDLKFQEKTLTFNPKSVPIETKTGRFLTGKVAHQPFAKRQCVPKGYKREHQSSLEVTIYGNMFNVRKYEHFVRHFREMMSDIMQFEPRLVVIPYPEGDFAKKGRPFGNDCSVLSSSYRCQIYINTLFILEGRPMTVKIFVRRDMPLPHSIQKN